MSKDTSWGAVSNIPDNTGVQKDVLCTLQYKEQDKKRQQFPLIGETAAGRVAGYQASTATRPPAEWGNCQKEKPEKAISPNPNGGGTAAQIWNLPNLEGVDKQSSITNNASTAKAELKCITVPEDAPIPCHAKDNNSLLAKPLPFHSQKGIPDNTKCLGCPV
ncbi:hypothetical protein DSO57_1011744 [Entomophthora muscae]|uniref:Uncharacterized protein n=1 Tax=Entomophthora muscae TaxID=34485 RepID=A0ACC2U3X8_9FUNG|nr:hypothetical protein DSO57_1011744 [Entomophthora muscae]